MSCLYVLLSCLRNVLNTVRIQYEGERNKHSSQTVVRTLLESEYNLRAKSIRGNTVVWDVYRKESLKSTTREKRGKSNRRRVAPTTTIPSKWTDILHVDDNRFLSQQVVKLPTDQGKSIYETDQSSALCSLVDPDLSSLAPCSRQEADTRLFLHVCSNRV